jgi:hypothetical protein
MFQEKTDIRNITVFIYNEWSDGDVIPSSEKSVADFLGPIVNDFMKSQKSMTVVCRYCNNYHNEHNLCDTTIKNIYVMSKHSYIRTAGKTISRRVTWMKVEMSCLSV